LVLGRSCVVAVGADDSLGSVLDDAARVTLSPEVRFVVAVGLDDSPGSVFAKRR